MKSHSDLPEAPATLTNHELVVWARRQFPQARGTIALLIHRLAGGTSSADYGSGSNHPIYPVDEVASNACPHCGSVLHCQSEQ